MLTGAQTLVDERWNATIGCFRSWDQNISNPTSLPFEVNIDQMMNLELILWAGQNGGPAAYVDYAISHADKTWEHNVREDGGTYHVVSYNLDGTVASKRTHQGWNRDSTWSRGQAWAVYGYTMVYRYTGLPRMLERARTCYDFFIAETLKDSADYIAYSDFDAPLDSRNPRDTSASAIVAAAALELYETTGEAVFLDDAEAILDSLSSPRYIARGTRYESILLKASEKWGEPEVGAIFADYYLLVSMYRWSQLEQEPAVVTGNWASYDILDEAFVDTGTWMGWFKYQYAPFLYNFTMEGWLYAPDGYADSSGGWFYSYR
jgi:rhamnogalacturonyl hydrolase YesR